MRRCAKSVNGGCGGALALTDVLPAPGKILLRRVTLSRYPLAAVMSRELKSLLGFVVMLAEHSWEQPWETPIVTLISDLSDEAGVDFRIRHLQLAEEILHHEEQDFSRPYLSSASPYLFCCIADYGASSVAAISFGKHVGLPPTSLNVDHFTARPHST